MQHLIGAMYCVFVIGPGTFRPAREGSPTPRTPSSPLAHTRRRPGRLSGRCGGSLPHRAAVRACSQGTTGGWFPD